MLGVLRCTSVGRLTVGQRLIAFVALFALVGLQIPTAQAVHDVGVFELDGNAVQNAATSPPDDWQNVYNGTDQAFVSAFVQDPTPATGGQDLVHANSNKDVQDIADWGCVYQSVPDNDDLAHAFAGAYDVGGDTHIYFGADRYDGQGSALVGVWFLQDEVTCDPQRNGGDFQGAHVIGDLLVLVEYTNGGAIGEAAVLRWVGTGGDIGGTLQTVASASGADCAAAPANDIACAISNTAAVPAPWPFTPKTGSPGIIPTGQFFEAGIDLGAILGPGIAPCAATAIVETRSTAAPNSGLQDLTILPFDLCAMTLTKSAAPLTYDRVGQEITYSYLVENTGAVALTNVVVTDDQLPASAISCSGGSNTIATLAPGAAVTCTATYTITQADIDAGSIANVGTADSDQTEPQTDDALVTAEQIAALSLEKTADPAAFDAPNATITYSYAVTNTGNITLTDVSVTDDKLATVTCPGGNPIPTLAPGSTVTCTATYATTQADVDAGRIDNVGTAASPDAPAVSDEATVIATQRPAINLEKIVQPGTYAAPGDPLTYTYFVANTGNVTVTEVAVTDDRLADGDIACTPGTGNLIGTLTPGQTATCTATYPVTQADIDAGQIVNLGTVDSAETEPVSDSATATALQDPSVQIVKVANPASFAAPGTTITYSYAVANTGNVTLTGLAVTDDRLATVTCPDGNPIASLAPGASTICTATYVTTLADLEGGPITNVGTVTATAGGDQLQETDDATITPVAAPELTLVKTSDIATYTAAGDVITYTYVVRNAGNVTLSDVTVVDDQLADAEIDCTPGSGNAVGTLVPVASATCTATRTVLQADLDADPSAITNLATASATDPAGGTLQAQDAVTVNGARDPLLTLSKTADRTSFSAVGEVITYSYVVTNAGNVTATNVSVTDDLIPAITCPGGNPLPTLAPGDSVTCAGTYSITQADIDARSVANTATADSDQTDPVTDDETVNSDAVPGIDVAKSADVASVAAAGDVITYTYIVTNTGAETLRNVVVEDTTELGATLTVACPGGNPVPTLLGNERITCTAQYTADQEDLDYGVVRNTVIASGTAPGGETVEADDTLTVPAQQNAGLAVDKSAVVTGGESPNVFTAAGQTIEYTIDVTNSGNVTLFFVEVTDPLAGAVTCPGGNPIPALAVGTTLTCTASYTVTQADLDTTPPLIENVVTAAGISPTEDPVTDQDSASVPGAQIPSISIEKIADPSVVGTAGDTVTYLYRVLNTGNITVGPITVTDDRIDAADISCTPGPGNVIASLPPSGIASCQATYTVTQADIDAGSIVNVATASAPQAPEVQDSATVDVEPARGVGISLIKVADPLVFDTAGQSIEYRYLVANVGDVTIDEIAVTDDRLGSALDCGDGTNIVTSLPPDTSQECTATYTITQADVDAGTITNVGTATPTVDGEELPPVTDDATITANQFPALELVKSAAPDSVSAVGEEITYTYEITNVGNITVTGISLTDDRIADADIDCGTGDNTVASVAPSETVTCTATYLATQADLDSGSIVNVAVLSADGLDPVEDSATVGVAQAPSFTLDKSADTASFDSPGLTITYSLMVTNTGNITLQDIVVVDDLLTTVTCPGGAETIAALAPGESATCTGTYTVTQADLDAGVVSNTATATAPDLPPVEDGLDIEGVRNPGFTVTKTPSATEVEPGTTVTYTYVVTNTGNVTLNGVLVEDDKCEPIEFTGADGGTEGALDPGETWTYSCAAVITADTTNVATVSAIPPGDLEVGPQTATATVTVTVPVPPPVPPEPELPDTGAHTELVRMGLLMLLSGGGALLLAGHQRRAG